MYIEVLFLYSHENKLNIFYCLIHNFHIYNYILHRLAILSQNVQANIYNHYQDFSYYQRKSGNFKLIFHKLGIYLSHMIHMLFHYQNTYLRIYIFLDFLFYLSHQHILYSLILSLYNFCKDVYIFNKCYLQQGNIHLNIKYRLRYQNTNYIPQDISSIQDQYLNYRSQVSIHNCFYHFYYCYQGTMYIYWRFEYKPYTYSYILHIQELHYRIYLIHIYTYLP